MLLFHNKFINSYVGGLVDIILGNFQILFFLFLCYVKGEGESISTRIFKKILLIKDKPYMLDFQELLYLFQCFLIWTKLVSWAIALLLIFSGLIFFLRISTFSDDNILPETGIGYDVTKSWTLSLIGSLGLAVVFLY